MNKRIVYLSKAIFPSETTHTLSIIKMCQAFSDEGHQVNLIGRSFNNDSQNIFEYYGLHGGFQIHTRQSRKNKSKIPLTGLFESIKGGITARKLIVKLKPDLIYSRLTLLELFFVPENIPIVYEMHSLGPLGKNIFQKFLFKRLVRRKNFLAIVVTTDMLSKMLQERLPTQRLIIARLSAEEPITFNNEDKPTFFKNNFAGKRYNKHVGYTGYLDTIGLRGTEILCQAASQIPDVAFHIVGGNSETVAYWKSYAEAWNQNSNIFFYGHKPANEIPYYLGLFDIALAPLQLRPSPRAPYGLGLSPLKIPQYMAYEKSIVASDIPAHREMLRHEETALLVPPDDVEAWAKAIRRLIKDSNLRDKLAQNASKEYALNYSPATRVKTILAGLE